MTMRGMLRKTIGALWRDTRGATAMEYVLIASLISVAAIFAIMLLGGEVRTLWEGVAGNLSLARANP